MSYYLFLDDIRYPHQATIHSSEVETEHFIIPAPSLQSISQIPDGSWEVVRSYNQFVAIIEARGLPKAVSFDHDLHDEHMRHYFNVTARSGIIEYDKLEHKTGKQCAEYFLDKWRDSKHTKKPKIFIHSANAWGRAEIAKALQELL